MVKHEARNTKREALIAAVNTLSYAISSITILNVIEGRFSLSIYEMEVYEMVVLSVILVIGFTSTIREIIKIISFERKPKEVNIKVSLSNAEFNKHYTYLSGLYRELKEKYQALGIDCDLFIRDKI